MPKIDKQRYSKFHCNSNRIIWEYMEINQKLDTYITILPLDFNETYVNKTFNKRSYYFNVVYLKNMQLANIMERRFPENVLKSLRERYPKWVISALDNWHEELILKYA
jgi:hypothetical protein